MGGNYELKDTWPKGNVRSTLDPDLNKTFFIKENERENQGDLNITWIFCDIKESLIAILMSCLRKSSSCPLEIYMYR